MNCPYCLKEETSVIESRILPDGDGIRRRRKCLKCFKRFTTHERLVNIDLKVSKKNGKLEQYDRDKLIKGVVKACYKRKVEASVIEDIVDRIEAILLNKESLVVKSSDIGMLVMKSLKKVDRLAYIRFASVYLDFDSFEDFRSFLLKKLKVKN